MSVTVHCVYRRVAMLLALILNLLILLLFNKGEIRNYI